MMELGKTDIVETLVKWVIGIGVVAVLFFTNPKDPARHREVALRRVDRIVEIVDAELNRSIAASGGFLYRKKSSSQVRQELVAECYEVNVTNCVLFCIGTCGQTVTLGVLNSIFDLSGLFMSDQEIRDMVWSDL